MKWTAQKQAGVTPAQVEVIWKRTSDHWIVVADRVCPAHPGCMVEPMRAEIAAIVESAPQMLEIIKELAQGKVSASMKNAAIDVLVQIEKTKNGL